LLGTDLGFLLAIRDALGVLNFFVFCAVSVYIGGDAKAFGGHFFLANAPIFFVTHPLAMLSGYLAKLEQKARNSDGSERKHPQ
jgi:hypothetical protein